MADPVQIQNKEEIAEEIGSNLGGSLKKIFGPDFFPHCLNAYTFRPWIRGHLARS